MLTVPVTEIELFCGPIHGLRRARHSGSLLHHQSCANSFVALRRNREIEADHVGQVYVWAQGTTGYEATSQNPINTTERKTRLI